MPEVPLEQHTPVARTEAKKIRPWNYGAVDSPPIRASVGTQSKVLLFNYRLIFCFKAVILHSYSRSVV